MFTNPTNNSLSNSEYARMYIITYIETMAMGSKRKQME